MKLSVIIPTYNRADTLRTCLERLLVQEGVDFEIIVVDDGSTDDTEMVMRDFPQVTYIKQANARQGAARNNGARYAKGEIIMFIGDDILAQPGLLMQHMDVHERNPQEEVVCLGYTTWDPSIRISPYMRFLEHSGWQFAYRFLNRGFIKNPEPYKFFYTSNISMKKSLFYKEPFNESFKEYGWEDIELGFRLWKYHGLRLYYKPEAIAHHCHEISDDSLEKRMETVGRTAKVFHDMQPTVNVIPGGLKGLIIKIAILPPFVAISSLFGDNIHFKLLSWRHFFIGVRSAK